MAWTHAENAFYHKTFSICNLPHISPIFFFCFLTILFIYLLVLFVVVAAAVFTHLRFLIYAKAQNYIKIKKKTKVIAVLKNVSNVFYLKINQLLCCNSPYSHAKVMKNDYHQRLILVFFLFLFAWCASIVSHSKWCSMCMLSTSSVIENKTHKKILF